MVLLSFYLIEEEGGRHKRSHLGLIDHEPTDWIELKFMLEEVMRIVYIEHIAWYNEDLRDFVRILVMIGKYNQ